MINHFAKCSIVKPIHVVKLAIRGTKITDHGRTLLSDEHYEERVYDESLLQNGWGLFQTQTFVSLPSR